MIKTAICYFTGSGNSFDIAIELCKYIDSESLYYIPNIKKNKLDDFDEVIIVTPVYAFDIPRNVQDFIHTLRPDCKYYIIVTCSSTIGQSRKTIRQLFKKNKLSIASIHKIIMPSSNTLIFRQPKLLSKIILRASRIRIRNVAKAIKWNESRYISLKLTPLIMNKRRPYSNFSSNLKQTNSCTKCMLCVELCPMENIHLYGDSIEFGDRCIACMGCYHRCPAKAIVYKGKKVRRYSNPNVDFKYVK